MERSNSSRGHQPIPHARANGARRGLENTMASGFITYTVALMAVFPNDSAPGRIG